MKNKFSIAISLAVIMAMVLTSLALADTITSDTADSVNGIQLSQNLGSVAPGASVTGQVSFQLLCGGNKHVDDNQIVNISFSSATLDGVTVPVSGPGSLIVSGASIGKPNTPSETDPGIPTFWPDDGSNCPNPDPTPVDDNGNSQVTITAPLTPGLHTYVIGYTPSLYPGGSNDPASITGNISSVTFTLTVSAPAGKSDQTISFPVIADMTFGDADFDPGATASSELAVSYSASGNCTIVSGMVHLTGGGGCTVTASQAGNDNFNAAVDVSQSFNIAKANAICTVTGYSGVYDGAYHGASGSCSGIGGESAGTLNLGTTFKDVSGGTAHWVFTGNGNYNDQSGDVAIVITKADATCTVTGYNVVYDGLPHTATGLCVGVGSDGVLSGLYLSGTTHTIAGDYPNDPWSFSGGTNYNDQADIVHDNIHFAICVLYDQTKAHKLGSTIPVKLQLCDAYGLNQSSASIVVKATRLVKVDNTPSSVLDSGNANSPDLNFRYDATLGGTGGYIFNLSTKGLSSGTWKMIFVVGSDPTENSVQFDIK